METKPSQTDATSGVKAVDDRNFVLGCFCLEIWGCGGYNRNTNRDIFFFTIKGHK